MTEKWKEGNIIQLDTSIRIILGICGSVYFISKNDDYTKCSGTASTQKELEDLGWKKVVPEEPRMQSSLFA